ncbi:glycerate kinase [Corynebacterium choanae]|uniref:Glycerate 2-kinase n=1 Tax=Corynebacterium choanae TaxID=1862358 RepID=A0A3G6J865_9CORY|nr:glycerate kinase [Corynebacterium choanae]AZA14295.1 Glycerate 2-kinase [Corynebacterium choanae]
MSEPLTVVIAPDSLKGTCPAPQVAAALQVGWRTVRPQDTLIEVPMADGGEGTAAVFYRAQPGAQHHSLCLSGPDGTGQTTSFFTSVRTQHGRRIAVVDVASTCGIELINQPIPLTGSTRALGEAIAAIVDRGVDEIIIGIGSSCSTDGGAGMLQSLGVRLCDGEGAAIRPGLQGLVTLESVDEDTLKNLQQRLADITITVLCDVDNPLTGPRGAATVFGPQKGLADTYFDSADTALANLCTLLGGDPQQPGAGAAGGLGMALRVLGATLQPGAHTIATLLGLDRLLSSADIVLTGEGSLDASSFHGKVVGTISGLVEQARDQRTDTEPGSDHRRPELLIVAGRITGDLPSSRSAAQALALTELAGNEQSAIDDPTRWLREAGKVLAKRATKQQQHILR